MQDIALSTNISASSNEIIRSLYARNFDNTINISYDKELAKMQNVTSDN